MTEEAQRVFEAMEAMKTIADPEHQARAISELLKGQKERGPELKELRRVAVEKLRDQGMTFRQISAAINVPLGTVQDILKKYSDPWGSRPRKAADPDPAAEQ